MSKKRISLITLLLAALLLLAGIQAGRAAHPAAPNGGGTPANNPWMIKTIESTDGIYLGRYVSLAYHGFAEKPYISHYDATNGDLRLAYPAAGSDTACDPQSDWACELVDSQGDVGQYTSFDYYYTSGGSNKLGIAYHDATNSALKIAIWSCSLMSCGWSISTIQQGSSALVSYGFSPSLVFDSNGDAHISYRVATSSVNPNEDSLMYASYVGSGGNCGVGSAAGQWQCDSVETRDGTGQHSSLALYGPSETPVIAHYASYPGEIRLCEWNGTTWVCTSLDSVAGGFPSLIVDASSYPRVAYYDSNAGTLKYASYNAGGNCGGGDYQCDEIDTIGTNLSQVGISMALDSGGYPVIAYQDASDEFGPAVLNTARPVDAYGLISGNCGPSVGLLHSWQCETIDNAAQGSGHLSEADFVSLDVDPTGLAYIAYYEYDDYYDVSNLKLAYQYRPSLVYLPLVVR